MHVTSKRTSKISDLKLNHLPVLERPRHVGPLRSRNLPHPERSTRGARSQFSNFTFAETNGSLHHTKPELVTGRALCFAERSNRPRILFIYTVFMPATAKPKLYNPRHPKRTLLHQTVAEHYETWLELASSEQLDGQVDRRTPSPNPMCAKHLPSTWSAASLPMALHGPSEMTAVMTTLWRSPATAEECALRG